MAKACINHQDQPAVTMCHQCHKPICKSCVMVTPQGSFCSSECSIVYREMKGKIRQEGTKSSATKIIVVVILFVIAAAFAIHLGARSQKWLRPFDIIGNYMPYPDRDREPVNP